ncbi:DUF3343 domain-containing protein [Dethiothermospora halolimnae]|uniref:DUF3343 domain-containing protein n=1 Tax=Dethiothermospora halolimnae TaxID=3114390 RepID=UPI003CCBDDC2
MIDKEFYVITFDSTNYAIKGEKLLLDKGFNIRTIPTPREVTASCGLSIKFDESILEDIKSGISNNDLNINGIYKIIRKGKERIAKQIC